MKKLFLPLAFLAMISCDNEETIVIKKPLHEYSLIETQIGDNLVYGVKLKLSTVSSKTEFFGYQVRLNKNDKTWIDTVYTDIGAGDTVEMEVFFSEAVVQDESNVTFNVKPFATKQ